MRERVVAIVGSLLGSSFIDPESDRSDFERRVLEAISFIVGKHTPVVTLFSNYDYMN